MGGVKSRRLDYHTCDLPAVLAPAQNPILIYYLTLWKNNRPITLFRGLQVNKENTVIKSKSSTAKFALGLLLLFANP